MASSLDFIYRHTSERRLLLWHCAQCATCEGKRNTFSVLLVRCFLSSKVSSDYDINEHRFRTLHVLIPLPATAQPVRTYNFVACVLDLPISVFSLQPASLLAPAYLSTLKFLGFRNPIDPPRVRFLWRLCAVFPKTRVLTLLLPRASLTQTYCRQGAWHTRL